MSASSKKMLRKEQNAAAMTEKQLQEQKVVGNKGVFKMELFLHVLYEDPQGKLCTYDWRIPLSQITELSCETGEGDLQTTIHFTDLDLEPDSQQESHRLFLRLHMGDGGDEFTFLFRKTAFRKATDRAIRLHQYASARSIYR